MLTERLLLILDLDETLIHGSEAVQNQGFAVGHFSVVKRPYVCEFMRFCCEHFDVAIWTTATVDYVEPTLHEICDFNDALEFIWCRERCTPRGEGFDGEFRWIKDLKKVRKKGWDFDRVLMVEDKPENLSRHYGNVIRIAPFTGDCDDRELLRLMPFLLSLKDCDNVRKIEKRGWKARFDA